MCVYIGAEYGPETFSSSLSSGGIASVSWGMEQSRVSGKSFRRRRNFNEMVTESADPAAVSKW